MDHLIFRFVFVALGVWLTVGILADTEEFEAGIDYKILEEQLAAEPSENIKVVEYFSYGCVHCYRIEKHIKSWLESVAEDVEFSREAVVLTESWAPYAKLFYTAIELDVSLETHMQVFQLIHDHKQELRKLSDLTDIFVEEAEVTSAEFIEVYESQAVIDKILAVHADFKIISKASHTSTPCIVVGDRYVVNTRTAGSQQRIFKVVDFLIDKIRESEPTTDEEDPNSQS